MFFRTRNDIYLDLRRFVHPQHFVIIKVSLFDASVLQRDLAVKSGGQTEDDAALHLCSDRVGINDLSAVYRTNYAMNSWLAVIANRNLGDLCDIAAKTLVNGNPAKNTFCDGFAPTAFFSCKLQHARVTRMFFEQRKPELQRIFFGGLRKLVKKTLSRKCRV